MTRKHFVAIATTLKALRPGDGVYANTTNSSAVLQWRKTVKAMADTCAAQHRGRSYGGFNRSTFYAACGFEE